MSEGGKGGRSSVIWFQGWFIDLTDRQLIGRPQPSRQNSGPAARRPPAGRPPRPPASSGVGTTTPRDRGETRAAHLVLMHGPCPPEPRMALFWRPQSTPERSIFVPRLCRALGAVVAGRVFDRKGGKEKKGRAPNHLALSTDRSPPPAGPPQKYHPARRGQVASSEAPCGWRGCSIARITPHPPCAPSCRLHGQPKAVGPID